MARYYFRLIAPRPQPDRQGMEFASPWEAQLEAARICGEMLRAYPERCWAEDTWRMDICDAKGLTLFSINVLPIAGALRLEAGPRK